MGKLWGGRFQGQTDLLMEQFQDSLSFDQRLYLADIRGSQAYAQALVGAGILTSTECQAIQNGLDQVLQQFESGRFAFAPGDEDIHTAVERRLTELIGPVAGKLHTGRSRNDQVATDTRLYLLDEIARLRLLLKEVQQAIVHQSTANLEVVMPGYTHLQPAQPVLFSHWLMSYFWMFQRDQERLSGVQQRTSVLPLGASALAGNAFPVDCPAMAEELGFGDVAQNSIDAVSDRDFVAEFCFWAALLQAHLSRLAEDLILWSSPAFGFIEMGEQYTTGSSIMPQKRNPDAAELLRGKTGRLNGHLISILTILKGLPSSYDKDLQEDKEPLFDAIDTLALALPITAGMIASLRIHADRMAAALTDDMLATELADYLVSKGVPFRQSHHMVGEAVRLAEAQRGQTLSTLPLEAYQAIDPRFGPDLYQVLDARRAVARRSVACGTAPQAVQAQIERAIALLH
jgi:argininosuccinate lyase